MRTITTTAGTSVDLDGDVLAVIEAISRDLTRRQELDYGFDDVDREFQHMVTQMKEPELRVYLKESLFMSFNRFEADRMMAIMKKANRATAHATPGTQATAAARKGRKTRTTAATRNKRTGRATPKNAKKRG
jgi:hypothetical protein